MGIEVSKSNTNIITDEDIIKKFSGDYYNSIISAISNYYTIAYNIQIQTQPINTNTHHTGTINWQINKT